MVLESLLNPAEAEKKPFDMLLLGFGTASISLWLAYYIFPEGASHWFLFFTGLCVVPLMVSLFALEEKEDFMTRNKIWERHSDMILIYLFLFLGMIMAFSFWYTLLPEGITSMMFKEQIKEVGRIQNLHEVLVGGLLINAANLKTGLFSFSTTIKTTGMTITKGQLLELILLNNLRLVFLFIAFSFVFGAGAILLLTWNAAVVGVAIGNVIRSSITASATMFAKTTAYFTVFPFSFTAFFVHGIFEVLGYFLGAIAGGIFSVAMVKKHYNSPYFKRIITDVSAFLFAAIIFILIGGYIEVYITPLL